MPIRVEVVTSSEGFEIWIDGHLMCVVTDTTRDTVVERARILARAIAPIMRCGRVHLFVDGVPTPSHHH